MIISLAVYGFAPYGWDLQSERAIIQQNNLAFNTEERMVVPSVWGGPPQQALVLLGALYGRDLTLLLTADSPSTLMHKA